MSRNAEEGFRVYEELFNKGIELIFIKEPHINTSTYKEAIKAFEAAVEGNCQDKQELYSKAVSMVDKAWSKGVLKKNTAARKKSSLSKLLNK